MAAAFFESTSSYLGGRRPRELLVSDPKNVMAKAIENRDSQDGTDVLSAFVDQRGLRAA
jgi:hypothetical protein